MLRLNNWSMNSFTHERVIFLLWAQESSYLSLQLLSKLFMSNKDLPSTTLFHLDFDSMVSFWSQSNVFKEYGSSKTLKLRCFLYRSQPNQLDWIVDLAYRTWNQLEILKIEASSLLMQQSFSTKEQLDAQTVVDQHWQAKETIRQDQHQIKVLPFWDI